MRLMQGDMWSKLGTVKVLLVTTNSTVRRDGHLVMGRGAALEATQKWSDLPFFLGSVIKDKPEYGVLIAPSNHSFLTWGTYIGAFQVKHHWRDDASLNLISMSTSRLTILAETFPNWMFVMNYPGIGNGRLDRSDVSQIIKYLPDNVEVWEK